MTRFVNIGGRLIRIDEIAGLSVCEDGQSFVSSKVLTDLPGADLELSKGEIEKLAHEITGHGFINQLLRVRYLYACYTKDRFLPVMYIALCADGTARPYGLHKGEMVFLDEIEGYEGLTNDLNADLCGETGEF